MASFSGRKCLVVLGMHRSGTSALSGALHLAGFELGKNIMPPAGENPKGFFENLGIVNLNDQILAELYNFWSDTLFIPKEWWKSDLFNEYKEKIRLILEAEFDGKKPLLIKDPRLCILLPLYLDVFSNLGIQPVFLICVRDPYEVANSLIKRNNLSQEKALLLWMDYQLKAEYYSRGCQRLFVSYAGFLKDPMKTVAEVVQYFGLHLVLDEKVRQEIGRFLDPALTHSVPKEDQPALKIFPQLQDAFQLQQEADLRDLAADELAAADRYRAAFTEMTRFFSGMPRNFQAMLTVTYENDETAMLTAPVSYGINSLSFAVLPGKKVKAITLRPCNSRVGLRIVDAEALLDDQQVIKIECKTANYTTKNKETQTFVYDTDLPKITVNLPQPLAIQKVSFRIDYLSFGTSSCRKVVNRPLGSRI